VLTKKNYLIDFGDLTCFVNMTCSRLEIIKNNLIIQKCTATAKIAQRRRLNLKIEKRIVNKTVFQLL